MGKFWDKRWDGFISGMLFCVFLDESIHPIGRAIALIIALLFLFDIPDKKETIKTEGRVSLKVHLKHDPEKDIWYVSHTDVPGLSLESDTPAKLLDRIIAAAPELIEENKSLLHKKYNMDTEYLITPVFEESLNLR